VLGLSADVEPLTTAAKLRAARVIWGKVTAACGSAASARIEARSSRRMLARMDAWSNLLRLTAAGFGAAAGGAEAVVLEPFTAPLVGPGQRPGALARRQARNIQLVLMEEAGLGRVADAAGGAGYVEALTDGLARAGWAALQAIEAGAGWSRRWPPVRWQLRSRRLGTLVGQPMPTEAWA
jgi:methylmalonyl-CoA mutase